MRTVIFILAMSVRDVAVALGGKKFPYSVNAIMAVIFAVCIVMDVTEFIREIK